MSNYMGIPSEISKLDQYGVFQRISGDRIINDTAAYLKAENPKEFEFLGFSGRPATIEHFDRMCRHLSPSKSPFKMPQDSNDALLKLANEVQQYLQGINAIGMIVSAQDDKKVLLDEYIAALTGAPSTPTYQLLESIRRGGYGGTIRMRMGEDSLRTLHKWTKIEVLIEHLDGVNVMPRGDASTETLIHEVQQNILGKLGELEKERQVDFEGLKEKVARPGFVNVLKMDKTELSSTKIRDAIKGKLSALGHSENELNSILREMLTTLKNKDALSAYIQTGISSNNALLTFLEKDENFGLDEGRKIKDIAPPYQNPEFLRTWKLQATILAIAELYVSTPN